MDVIAGDVEIVGRVRRKEDRKGPLKAVFETLRPDAPTEQLRPDGDVAHLSGAVVVVGHDVVVDVTAGRTGCHDVPGLVRLDPDVSAFTTTGDIPGALMDRRVGRPAGQAQGGVVLLRAIDPVGELIVGDHVIEL